MVGSQFRMKPLGHVSSSTFSKASGLTLIIVVSFLGLDLDQICILFRGRSDTDPMHLV